MSVAEEQEARLKRLGELRRPIELIRYLDEKVGGSWSSLAEEYLSLHEQLGQLEAQIDVIRQKRYTIYAKDRALARARLEAERIKGDHFRAFIFEKDPRDTDLAERERLGSIVSDLIHDRLGLAAQRIELRHEQNALVGSNEVKRIHQRRREIELEAELKRLTIIREAVISSKGLQSANLRPSAWWFRLVCPDGNWFRHTTEQATYYLEPLN
jgi:hypothetical protein